MGLSTAAACRPAHLVVHPVPALTHAGPFFDWPVDAQVSSGFGTRDGRPHEGVDLVVGDGTPVHAVADGTVVYADHKLRGYGNLVILRHDEHLMTVYAHNQKLLVRDGERVRRGEVISLSGHTGHVTAPHVHFEVRDDGVPRDPLRYLAPRRARLLTSR